MATIILAYEYERDAFHMAQLDLLQIQLNQMGHHTYRIGSHFGSLAKNTDLTFLPAPRAPTPTLHKPRSILKLGGYDDRLSLLGFNDANILNALVTAWEQLFLLIKPDLLIVDAAPTALLAAYKNIPCLEVSDGFSLPPKHLSWFPRLRPDAPPFTALDHLQQNVEQVLAKRHKSMSMLPAVFQSEKQFICHLPEFDPYRSFREAEAIYGSLSTLPTHRILDKDTDYFLACLDNRYPDYESIMIGLTALDKPGIFLLMQGSDDAHDFLCARGMRVCDDFQAFNDSIQVCDFVVHHGNTLVAQAALAAGVPQFALPQHFESDWVGSILVHLGIGHSIYPEMHPITTTVEIIEARLKEVRLRDWANLRAEQLMQNSYKDLLPQILKACEEC